ncbi:MAG: ribbon-helix-helix domain-containing protein [Sphingorhabdus sp.]
MNAETRKWTIVVDKETDINLRTHLAQKGMKKGDLSKFVENAVNWRVLRETMEEVREGFKDLSSGEVEMLVDEAVAWARSPEGIASGNWPDKG